MQQEIIFKQLSETGFDGADATGDHLQAAIHADADQWSQTWME